jgi:hypothetical protein
VPLNQRADFYETLRQFLTGTLNEKVLYFVLVFEFEITILADLVDVWTY